MKEKIVNILMDELCYCDCDSCEYRDWDKYQDHMCENCYRKYISWELSSNTAAKIAERILKEAIYDVE